MTTHKALAAALALALTAGAAVAQTATPDTAAPETAAPETVAPESAAPESAAPETTAPEATAPGTLAPETPSPETAAPEATAPDAEVELAPLTTPETEVVIDEAPEAPLDPDPLHGDEAEHGAGHDTGHIEDVAFSFEGPFGAYDQMQLQRGLQVYTEICAACHGLQYVTYRALAEEGGPALPEDQVRAYAARYETFDQTLLEGEGDFRPSLPTDHFPQSAITNAPDLSLMAKARAGFHGPYGLGINQFFRGIGGAEYINAILTSYTGNEREQAGTVFYENTAFPGGWISMPQPLYGEDVEYADGHENDLHHVSMDVSAFLMWTAEPKMMARKQAGFVGVLMLAVLAVLLYLTNKRIWAPIKHGRRDDMATK